MDAKNIKWLWVIILIIVALLAVATVGFVGKSLNAIPEGRFTPEISLTILLLAGVVLLIVILTIAVAIMAALGLSDSAFAFGMPEGTIRAVIALSLVLIFSIVSLFLYSQLRTPVHTVIDCLTQEQRDDIPSDILLFFGQSGNPNCPDTNRYYARILVQQNEEASEDFAKQILTTVSTLVVAVAGFYFGSRAVSAARGAVAPVAPLLRSIEPHEGKQGEPIDKVVISGRNFASPQKVKLVRGSNEMTIENVMSSPTRIEGKLTVSNEQEPGKYELIVVNADGSEDLLPEAFEVTKKS